MSQQDPPLTPLHPWQWPEKPWQRLHIDYAGPFMGSMFLIAVDAHSKWAEVIPASSTTSTATINILNSMFARFGLPEQVVSDNGPQFASDEFKAFMNGNHIKHIRSAPYHPATNGLAERMVQTFKNAMKAAKNDQGSISTKLARFLLAYRNSPHCTTGATPASLMFGRHLRTKLDILTPSVKNTVTNKQNLQEKSHSQATPCTFNVGDHVLVRDYRGHEKWQHGQISAQTGSRNYEIEISPGVIWRRHSDQIVHTSSPVPEPKQPPMVLLPPTSFVSTKTTSSKNAQPASPVIESGRESNSPWPRGESPNSPQELLSRSSSLSDPQSERVNPDKRKNYTTRSGRVVRLPNKYND